jgi:polysaccharide biosynthesis transport protein
MSGTSRAESTRVGLYEYLTVVRWRWRFLALFVLIVVGGVTLLSVLMTPLYTTKATVYFVTQVDESDAELTEVVLYPETMVRSYAEAATQPLVLDAVIRQLGLRVSAATLADSVDANSPLGTVIIEIKATDPSARQAAAIANAVATQLVKASDPNTAGAALADASIRVSTIAAAGVPKSPSQPRKPLMIATALVWSVLIGAGLCIWLARIDPRIRSRTDISGLTPAPLLGYLPRERRWGRLLWWRRPQHDSSSRAHWGQLRTNFAVLRESGSLTSLLFVSAAADQAPSRVISHLGGALLAAGTRVLVIDADLRPTRAEQFGLGLSSVLLGQCAFREAVIQLPDQPARLYSGPGVSDPAGALASAEMAALLRAAEQDYEVVLIRTAPLLAATEALALSQAVDGVVLVGDSGPMPRQQFSRMLSALNRAGGRLRGVVLCA